MMNAEMANKMVKDYEAKVYAQEQADINTWLENRVFPAIEEKAKAGKRETFIGCTIPREDLRERCAQAIKMLGFEVDINLNGVRIAW
jgi:hypothetical protein